jgi:hypothetical protein
MGVPALTERTSSQYTCVLHDETGAAAGSLVMGTLVLTLYDLATGTALNARTAQNVLNANGVTLDSAGHLVWTIAPADNAIVTSTLSIETHIALFEASWAAGTKEAKWEVSLPVRNVNRVTT